MDTGIGIPEDKITKLFKAFSQVDASTTRKYGGTGLGLVICERIISLMGGQMGVSSKLGKGTTFHFEISCQKGHEKPANKIQVPSGDFSDKRVLLVDDNPTNLRILSLQLKPLDLKLELASSASRALDLLSGDGSFDLIITDMGKCP